MTGVLMLVVACGHICNDEPVADSFKLNPVAQALGTGYFADMAAPTTAECAQFCELINDGTARCTVVLPDGYTSDNLDSAEDEHAVVHCSGFAYAQCQ